MAEGSATREVLKPDFSKALEIFAQHWPSVNVQRTMLSFNEICEHNAIYSFAGELKVKDIPSSGGYWRWNQTKGRQTVHLEDHNVNVSFFKLIPRRLPTSDKTSQRSTVKEKLPSLKLWIYRVDHTQTLLWCEQGAEKAFRAPNIDTKFPSLQELEFLKNFVDVGLWDVFWPANQSPN